MSHNLYNNGARFIGRESAWHRLGRVKGDFLTRDEVQSTIDYPVTKEQLASLDGMPLPVWGTFAHLDGKKNFLGSVGEGYTILPASRGLEMIDALMGVATDVKYESAGVIGQGNRVFAAVNLAKSFEVAGAYEHKSYLNFLGSYDGSCSHTYVMSNICTVCNNTFEMNDSITAGAFKVRHTRNGERRLQEVHQTLLAIDRDATDMAKVLNMLAEKKVEKHHMISLLDQLFPPTKKENGEVKESTRRENILTTILESYQEANDKTFTRTAGTAYNALQAITGFVDHARGQDDNRAEVAVLGSGNKLKQSAYEIIMEQSSSMSPIYTRAWSKREQGSLLDTIISAA